MVRLSELDEIEESLLTMDQVIKAERMLDNLKASGFDIRGPYLLPLDESTEGVTIDPSCDSLTPLRCISSLHFIPLRFNSHRARDRALGHRQLLTEREVISTGNWKFRACWSVRGRVAKGGFYIIEPTLAKEILARNIKGVTTLRGPYDDLRWCW